MSDVKDSGRYRENLQGEIDSAALYKSLAEVEENPHIASIYRRLAAVEESHAEYWRKKLKKLGEKLPPPSVGIRSRLLAWLGRRFGPGFVLPDHADRDAICTEPAPSADASSTFP